MTKVIANDELEEIIIEAFSVYDHSGKNNVDGREMDNLLRGLGCCPTQAEIKEVVSATENKEMPGIVPLHNFMPYIYKALTEHRFYPATIEELLKAFKYFDPEDRGFLSKEMFTKVMIEEGEPLAQEELDEMMDIAVDPVTEDIRYEYYIDQLTHIPKTAYDVADKLEAIRQAEIAAKKEKHKIII